MLNCILCILVIISKRYACIYKDGKVVNFKTCCKTPAKKCGCIFSGTSAFYKFTVCIVNLRESSTKIIYGNFFFATGKKTEYRPCTCKKTIGFIKYKSFTQVNINIGIVYTLYKTRIFNSIIGTCFFFH